MTTLKNLPYDSIWGSIKSVDYNKILKSTGSFDYYKQEYLRSFTLETNTVSKGLDLKNIKVELAKDPLKEHQESVMFDCENLWEEENA